MISILLAILFATRERPRLLLAHSMTGEQCDLGDAFESSRRHYPFEAAADRADASSIAGLMLTSHGLRLIGMSDRNAASRKARLIIAFALLLSACSKHDRQYPTPWLRVDVLRPRADELIRIGSIEERYEIKIGHRWQKLGVGHRSGYTILGEDALTASAVVVNLDHPRGKVLVRPDGPPRWLEGAVYFPNGVSVDVMQNNGRQAHIERYDAMSNQTTSFVVSVPDAYSDCRINGIKGYSDGVPYVDAVCDASASRARCLLIAAGKPQTVDTVKPDQPQSDCDFRQLHLSMASPTYRHFD